jgi:hypothetical protein
VVARTKKSGEEKFAEEKKSGEEMFACVKIKLCEN